ncbi:vitamin K epoxide reductase family protein [Streptomyces sp. NPDC017949]|uniref:vitamin K epoxide reductase family protein n=1 Tax=Streptomyces sp. NPDC017949 TaxID=3365020 RepID=UPI00379FF92C
MICGTPVTPGQGRTAPRTRDLPPYPAAPDPLVASGVGTAAGFAFTVWLIGQCLYVIGALCPWCVLVRAVVIPLFRYVTRYLSRPGSALRALPHRLVPLTLYAVVAVLVLERFGTRLL